MKGPASKGRIPAIAYVNIRAMVTIGFTNIVAEVVIMPPPTSRPMAKPVNLDPPLTQPYIVANKMNVPRYSAK